MSKEILRPSDKSYMRGKFGYMKELVIESNMSDLA